jgi:hypothetical protein
MANPVEMLDDTISLRYHEGPQADPHLSRRRRSPEQRFVNNFKRNSGSESVNGLGFHVVYKLFGRDQVAQGRLLKLPEAL